MSPSSLFELLELAHEKPAVFSRYTASELWTDEHTSAQMLAYHLNEDIDVSSRRGQFINKSVNWIQQHFTLAAGSRIADFGCGPGLYCSRLAQPGVEVVGIDFSARSINHAREHARQHGLAIDYVEANYLDYCPDGKFDLIIMIMMDFCALAPEQRAGLLTKFKGLLADGGRILLDVYSLHAFESKVEGVSCEKDQLNGFWSAAPYYAFVSSFKYAAEKVTLDKYTIIEADRRREVYNWLQCFSPDTLGQEVQHAGLEIEALYADVAGNAYDPDTSEFAVVLKARH